MWVLVAIRDATEFELSPIPRLRSVPAFLVRPRQGQLDSNLDVDPGDAAGGGPCTPCLPLRTSMQHRLRVHARGPSPMPIGRRRAWHTSSSSRRPGDAGRCPHEMTALSKITSCQLFNYVCANTVPFRGDRPPCRLNWQLAPSRMGRCSGSEQENRVWRVVRSADGRG